VRTPRQITLEGSRRWAAISGIDEETRAGEYPSLEEKLPEVYRELNDIQHILESHYRDMQDLEFTVQEGKLWLLQTRTGKRTGAAMVKIAIDMMHEGIIDDREALLRINPEKINELLHPVFEEDSLSKATLISSGLPASPGAATGKIVFFADEAEKRKAEGEDVILVRIETSPEDLAGMDAANGILTARGGMTSHAAVVARGMGKTCVAGAGALQIDYKMRTLLSPDGKTYHEGDWISLDGSTGRIYEGKIPTIQPELKGEFEELMKLAEKKAKLYVRANADTPKDARTAREFGARGIGLCRTEHMFFEGEKIIAMREMILAEDESGRRKALDKLLPIQRKDFEGIFEAMQGFPVTVRLLDPPLHEFVPHDDKGQSEMAEAMGVSVDSIKKKIEDLSEFNPMLGHRGCRLGNTYPEITEMQTRAIIEAALNLKKRGIQAIPEIMVPLVGKVEEMKLQEQIIRKTIEIVFQEYQDEIQYKVGTMIEIPMAALTADEIAQTAEFFSFGTNDLTQMTFGYSRDDAGKFLPIYLNKGILQVNPFESIDQEGVGQLVKMAVEKGKQSRPDLSIGICGEHGGDPESIDFFHRTHLHYVSCSPYRVPIAWIAAAQANLR
jgi:pyruvate,orthophosphate dikinase